MIHIYCGEGKGKTTAAVGLAVRAFGAGKKVCFAQFMKTGDSSELSVLAKLEGLRLELAVNSYGFTWNMTSEQKEQLTKDNNKCLQALIEQQKQGQCEVLILDEVLSAYQKELLNRELVLSLVSAAAGTEFELVLTGREAAKELLEKADYITSMTCVRHPYEKGITARKGIEY